jgi:hypothetical protein
MTSGDITRLWFIVTASGSALAVAAAVYAFHRRRLKRAGAASPRACGRCGYDVRGLPTFACPECGSDLREVGIVAPGSPPHAPPLFFAALRATWPRLLLAAIAIAAATAAAAALAVALILSHEVRPSAHATLEPASKAYRVLVATGGRVRHAAGRANAANQFPYAGERLTLKLAAPGGVFNFGTELDVNLANWSSTTHHWINGVAPTTPIVAFDRAVLERFFRDQKLADPARPAFATQLDALMALIDACRSSPIDRVVTSRPPAGFMVSDVADTTAVTYAGSDPVGMSLLAIAGGIWAMTAAAIVITGMYRLRDGVRTPSAGRATGSALQ